MLEIKKNDFLKSGRITYEDEYNNTAIFIKKDNIVSCKLRPNNKNVKLETLNMVFPLKNESGVTLNYTEDTKIYLETTDDMLLDVNQGIYYFSQLIHRWIGIYYAVESFVANSAIIASMKDSDSYEELCKKSIENIENYEELSFFSKND